MIEKMMLVSSWTWRFDRKLAFAGAGAVRRHEAAIAHGDPAGDHFLGLRVLPLPVGYLAGLAVVPEQEQITETAAAAPEAQIISVIEALDPCLAKPPVSAELDTSTEVGPLAGDAPALADAAGGVPSYVQVDDRQFDIAGFVTVAGAQGARPPLEKAVQAAQDGEGIAKAVGRTVVMGGPVNLEGENFAQIKSCIEAAEQEVKAEVGSAYVGPGSQPKVGAADGE